MSNELQALLSAALEIDRIGQLYNKQWQNIMPPYKEFAYRRINHVYDRETTEAFTELLDILDLTKNIYGSYPQMFLVSKYIEWHKVARFIDDFPFMWEEALINNRGKERLKTVIAKIQLFPIKMQRIIEFTSNKTVEDKV